MSDLNDDLLNYELGDLEGDDEIGGDEDELLLSDEDTSENKDNSLIEESEEWISSQLSKNTKKSIIQKGLKNKSDKRDCDVKTISKEQNSNLPDKNVLISNDPISCNSSSNNSDEKINSKNEEENLTIKNEVVLEKNEESIPVVPVIRKINRTNIKAIAKTDLTDVDIKVESSTNVQSVKESEVTIPIEPSSIENDQTEEINPNNKINEVTSSVVDEQIEEKDLKLENNSNKTRQYVGYEDETSSVENTLNSSTDYIVDSEELDFEHSTDVNTTEYEDDDEKEERMNPKTCVERENIGEFRQIQQKQNPGFGPNSIKISVGNIPRQMRPHTRPYMGNLQRPQFQPHLGDMYQANQYNLNFIPGEYRSQIPNIRGPQQMPNSVPPFGMRGPRPDLLPNQPFRPYNPVAVRPGAGVIGSGGIHPRFEQIRNRPPMPGYPNHPQNRPGLPNPNFVGPRAHQIQPPTGPQPIVIQQPANPVLPRKILLNPNFKHGGWEAAKSQLILDNFINNPYTPPINIAKNDDELLRQQEAFINQNRLHIEKRRLERSPERERERVRDRDREYSPHSPSPRRERRAYSRDRDYGERKNYRGRGGKRYGANTDIGRNNPKRRRSESLERNINTKNIEEEDEETRAYRLKIENQKAMREKILREKEERRKRAAEDKLKELKKEENDVPPKKLTPIVVKESKIISLKKKSDSKAVTESVVSSTSSSQSSKIIPTAKIIPETKKVLDSSKVIESTMAVVKPQMKKPQMKLNDEDDDDEIDEDALLADSPPPSPTKTPPLDILKARRIVLKPVNEPEGSLISSKTFSSTEKNLKISKGIFDRLDKKSNSISESSKRKINEASKSTIQRIVINNTE